METNSPVLRYAPYSWEIVLVLVIAISITGYSYDIAYHAELNTPNDPTFRDLVRPESMKPWFKAEYLYGPLLFECIGLISLAAILLPRRVRDYLVLPGRIAKKAPSIFFACLVLILFGGHQLARHNRTSCNGAGQSIKALFGGNESSVA